MGTLIMPKHRGFLFVRHRIFERPRFLIEKRQNSTFLN